MQANIEQVNWTTGEMTARYWVLSLLITHFKARPFTIYDTLSSDPTVLLCTEASLTNVTGSVRPGFEGRQRGAADTHRKQVQFGRRSCDHERSRGRSLLDRR